MKILITGARGMVARAAMEYFGSLGDEVTGLVREQMNISDRDSVFRSLDERMPEAVVNCAAYTNVDGAEANEAVCYAANAAGPENLAAACKETGVRFVTISTDYVFGGERNGFYIESDKPDPLSVYARSKYEGELRAAAANADALIVRSGWIYGPGGTNFLSIMPRLLREGRQLKAVCDQYGTPTYAGDLVRRIRELIDAEATGLFHAANSGEGTTYLGFAEECCGMLGADSSLLTAVTDAELKRPAARPANSRLASERETGLSPMPDWKGSLRKYVEAE